MCETFMANKNSKKMKKLIAITCTLILFLSHVSIGQPVVLFNETFAVNPFPNTATTAIPQRVISPDPPDPCSDGCSLNNVFDMVADMNQFCGCAPAQSGNGSFMAIDGHTFSEVEEIEIVYSRAVPPQAIEHEIGTLNVSLSTTHRFPNNGNYPNAAPVTFRLNVFDFSGALIPNAAEITIPVGMSWESRTYGPLSTCNGISRIEIVWPNDTTVWEDFAIDDIIAIYTPNFNSPSSPVPIAFLSDESGNAVNSICYWDDIFINADLSSNYNQYFISLWEKDADGNTINYARFDPWWRLGPIPSPFNISQDLKSGNWAYTNIPPSEWAFCPNGSYQIQFVLRNNCDGWEAITMDLIIEECEEPEIEVVEENCGSTLVRVKMDEKLVIPIASFYSLPFGHITDVYYEDGYYYGVVSATVTSDILVGFSATTVCSFYGTSDLIHVDCGLSPLPVVPPMELQYVCCNDPDSSTCYDFAEIKCLTGFTAVSSTSKLKVSINGTQICLSTDCCHPFIATLYVTPIGECGDGDILIWTIYGNFTGYCNGGGEGNEGDECYDEVPLISNSNTDGITNNQSIAILKEKDKETKNPVITDGILIYPNPISLSNSNHLKLDNIFNQNPGTTISVEIINISGQTLKHIYLNENSGNEINMDGITPGIYFIKISDGIELMQVEKIVVME